MRLKQRLPFLRWSFWRLAIGARNITKTGQIGDGRESAAADYVVANARQGDIDDAIAKVDEFAYEKSLLINIGDEKGELLDAAVRRANPSLALELGTYCGYSSLRIARAAPSAKVFSVERSAANAEVAQRIWAQAGIADRVTCVVGTIGDGGRTLDALGTEHGFAAGKLDFLFIDHDKGAYLPDLQSILDRGWLHYGSIVVADNMLIPGSPKYREFMNQQQSKLFDTVAHKTHGEYETLAPDVVLESEYLARRTARGRSASPYAWTAWPYNRSGTAGRRSR